LDTPGRHGHHTVAGEIDVSDVMSLKYVRRALVCVDQRRRRGWPRGAGLLLAMVAACGCGGTAPTAGTDSRQRTEPPWFVELALQSGLDFVHHNGMSGQFYEAEIFAPGVALFDFDNDGDLDVYLPQGHDLAAGSTRAPDGLRGRLFRNDLAIDAGGTPRLRFTDVTAASGLDARGYGMGAATGDFNNDGWVDLYLTHLGSNQLFRNNGDGTFTDVSRRSGTDATGWSVSASFVDIDRDGWLDLYVGNYLRYTVETDIDCFDETGAPDYCAPTEYRPQPDRLFRNRRDGTFEDVTAKALVGGDDGPALGVIAFDANADGWMDIAVANDGQENQLWINQRDGTFRNLGVVSGLALNAAGRPEANMGIDAGDFDNDGDDDVFITHWAGEKNTLFTRTAAGLFEDRTATTGLGPPSLPMTGFGTAWLDVDNDGWLDLLVVNGAVITKDALVDAQDPFPLHEPKQLFRSLGNGRFEDISARGGAAIALSEVGRGAAFGDIDNDGDVDVVVGNNNGRARLLVNMVGNRNHWIGLRLAGGRRAGDIVGARVSVTLADGRTLWRRTRADGSYGSANDPRLVVGLGASSGRVDVRVQWPDGRVEQFEDLPVDRWTMLTQGTDR
jgi:hypothetical protein